MTSGPKQLGRRIAAGLYYLVVVMIALASLVQISRQVHFAEPSATAAPYTSCAEGLRALYEAIERGRHAAKQLGTAPGSAHHTEAALIRYRREVATTWQYRDQVARSCQGRERRALDSLERLRYLEEHGVRYQAAELDPLRRRVRTLVAPSLAERPAP